MLFTSTEFIILLAITFIFYYLPILRGYQVAVLLVSSFIFYAWSNPSLLMLLLFSIAINSVTSYRVAFAVGRRQRVWWAVGGVTLNLAILILFKYASLVTRLTLRIFTNVETPTDGIVHTLLQLPLPIGISFYTFEGISLVVDTFRRRQDVEVGKDQPEWRVDPYFLTHATRTAFFVAFFPHLIAGPVLKAKSFFPQINPKSLSGIEWDAVFVSLLTGYFLKVVIADNLHEYTFWLSYPYFETRSTVDNIVLVYGYSIQIFADFAGYSLIAVGLGGAFGYNLMQNFNFPYISRSLAEFWGRWHISLSTWLRDYLYIPLGGNRKSARRTYLNLMIVMALGGLWHGAALSFAVWGIYHGIGLVIERLCSSDKESLNWSTQSVWIRFPCDLARVSTVFIIISIGWILFKIQSLAQVLDFIIALGRNVRQPPDFGLILPILVYSLPVALYHLPHFPTFREARPNRASAYLVRFWNAFRYLVFAMMIMLLILNPGPSEAFIYFQF